MYWAATTARWFWKSPYKRAEPALTSAEVCKALLLLRTRAVLCDFLYVIRWAEPAPASAKVCKAFRLLRTRAVFSVSNLHRKNDTPAR